MTVKYKKILLLTIALVIGCLTCLIVFYQQKNKTNRYADVHTKSRKNTLSDTLKILNQNPLYLESDDLKKIAPHEYIEYFRQGLIAHKYSTDPKKEFGLKIEKNFPGESGRVIGELFKAYIEYDSFTSLIDSNSSLDDYDKWNEKINSREIFFGKDLTEKLFLQKDSELNEKFFYYTKSYLKKHELENFRSKSIHIEKARREIYGQDFEKLLRLEPAEKKFELEMDLRKNEMDIMTEEEKSKMKKEILDNLNK